MRLNFQAALASSWLIPDVLLALSVALAACGTPESVGPTSAQAPSAPPSPSSTPIPSATPTTSPSPSPVPSAAPDSLVQDHPDGSKSFVDRKIGYTITFPPSWIILEMSEGKNDAVFSAASKEFPDLQDRIAIFSLSTPDIRMFALSTDPEFLDLEAPPIMGVLIIDSPSSPSLDFMLDASVQALSKFLEAEILSSKLHANSEGVPLGMMTYKFGPENDIDALANTFGKAVMFYAEDTLVAVTGSVSQAHREVFEPVFDAIFDNIALVDS